MWDLRFYKLIFELEAGLMAILTGSGMPGLSTWRLELDPGLKKVGSLNF